MGEIQFSRLKMELHLPIQKKKKKMELHFFMDGLNEIQAGEMVEFSSSVKGVVSNLENENVAIIFVGGDFFFFFDQ